MNRSTDVAIPPELVQEMKGLGVIAVPLQTTTAVAAVARPASFGTVTSAPGLKPGGVTITWKHDGANTTRYEVETGLTSFSRNPDSSLPLHGRGCPRPRPPSS